MRSPPSSSPTNAQSAGAATRGPRWIGSLAIALGLTCVAPAASLAQSASYFDRNNAGGVLDRLRPDYQALGIDAGGFQIFPSLTVTPEYDDNIYVSTDDKQSDLITNIAPSIRARSNWSRNEVDAFANLSSNLYADHSSEDTTDYSFGANGRLDILTQSNLSGGLSYATVTQPRTSEDTIGSANAPVQYKQASANVASTQTLNRVQFTETVNFQRVTYDNTQDFFGNPIVLSTLDSNAYQVSGRADYALSPQIALFVSGQGNIRRYDDQPPVSAFDRDSSGYETTIGADFDITRLVRGQVQVGYLEQIYSSSTFHTVNGPVVHARVAYFFSGLTTFTVTADRSVIDAVDPIAVSFLQTRGGFQVDHELLRNVLLSGRFAYETDDFTGEQRDDRRVSASASVTYLLNRHLGLTGEYSFLNEDSSGAARIGNYAVNVISIALVFQL